MRLSKDILKEIIEKSAFLEERIMGDFLQVRDKDEKDIEKYIEKWKGIVAKDRDDLF